MTPRIAFWLALILAAAIFVDYWFFEQAVVIWLARRLFALVEWLAFWNRL
jgi:hypothetical protein